MKRAKGTSEAPADDAQAKQPKKITVKMSDADEAPKDIAVAATEANEALKAMAPDLGDTTIETVKEESSPPDAEPSPAKEEDVLIDEALLEELNKDEGETPTAENQTNDIENEVATEEGDALADEESAQELADNEQESTDSTEPQADDQASEKNAETSSVDDAVTDKAIDDIVAEEGDKVLEAEDVERVLDNDSSAFVPKPKGLKAALSRFWSRPGARWGVIIGSILIILGSIIVPQSRYFMLNTVGVRSSLSLRVLDGGTMQPLKNVKVSVAGISGQTDSAGNVKLDKLRLGRTKLLIEKRAFSNSEQTIIVGWGSNPLGDFRVTAVGSQYTFFVRDYLSDKPIDNVEAVSGDGNASADEEGKLVLTLDTAELDDNAEISVDISAESYRTETVKLAANNKEAQSVKMVPDHKHVYVSKRSGKYDVYTMHIDGKNEAKIVPGTGLERDDITLLPHQQDDIAALVSTRENVRDSDGYLLSTLYLIDTKTGELVKIDQSERIQVIGWSKSGRLVYVKIASGASGANPKRHRLMSFNSQDYSDVKELASSNSFNDVVMAMDRVYFAPSNIYQENTSEGLFAINPDGQEQKTILDKEVYNIFRSSYETFDIGTGASWYSYAIGSNEGAKVGAAPSSQYSKVFTDNPKNNFSLWVDSRDGKGVLLNYDKSTKAEATLANRSGLKVPVYWLTEKHVVYRISDSKETADYVLNIDGGEPKKIGDVTDTNGVDRWYYY